jgi:hypothetical protein
MRAAHFEKREQDEEVSAYFSPPRDLPVWEEAAPQETEQDIRDRQVKAYLTGDPEFEPEAYPRDSYRDGLTWDWVTWDGERERWSCPDNHEDCLACPELAAACRAAQEVAGYMSRSPDFESDRGSCPCCREDPWEEELVPESEKLEEVVVVNRSPTLNEWRERKQA